MTLQRWPWYAPIAIGVIVLLYGTPLVWMFLSSLKPSATLTVQMVNAPRENWAWSNYQVVLREMPFARYLANSVLLCAGSVVGTLFSCSLAAYAFARLRWPGRQFWFVVLVGTMLLPWHVTMVPRFLLLRQLGLYNSLWALIAPTFLGNAFYIFLLRQFFLTIPEELREAGRIDGLSEWGIWWQIFLPLSRPALATVALFQGISAWNDLSGPLLYLNDPERFPLAYGLERFVSAYSDQSHLLLAAAVLFSLPPLLLFFFAQRLFVAGIATTGLKR